MRGMVMSISIPVRCYSLFGIACWSSVFNEAGSTAMREGQYDSRVGAVKRIERTFVSTGGCSEGRA